MDLEEALEVDQSALLIIGIEENVSGRSHCVILHLVMEEVRQTQDRWLLADHAVRVYREKRNQHSRKGDGTKGEGQRG